MINGYYFSLVINHVCLFVTGRRIFVINGNWYTTAVRTWWDLPFCCGDRAWRCYRGGWLFRHVLRVGGIVLLFWWPTSCMVYLLGWSIFLGLLSQAVVTWAAVRGCVLSLGTRGRLTFFGGKLLFRVFSFRRLVYCLFIHLYFRFCVCLRGVLPTVGGAARRRCWVTCQDSGYKVICVLQGYGENAGYRWRLSIYFS